MPFSTSPANHGLGSFLALFIIIGWLCCSADAETITITHGGVYSGDWRGTNTTPAVTIATNEYVAIYQSNISGPNYLIYCSWYNNVTVQDCHLEGTNPNVYGQGGATGIYAVVPAALQVFNNRFSHLRTSILEWDNFQSAPYISIWANLFEHQNARESNGADGWIGVDAWGPNVAIMGTRSYALLISYNDFRNIPGQDEPGDQINLYQTTGAVVEDNYIEGAVCLDVAGTSNVTNGIVTDDPQSDGVGGAPNWSTTTQSCRIANNTLVCASLGIWAGHDNVVDSNTVINSGQMPGGAWIVKKMFGLGRFIPEGATWAQTNVVKNNSVVCIFNGTGDDMINQSTEVNWSGNVSLPMREALNRQQTAYGELRQPVLTHNGISIGPTW
jgi:hypothetical protein